jgi:hypothetical protein
MPEADADLVYDEYVVCLQQMRSLRVTEAFLDLIASSQQDSG